MLYDGLGLITQTQLDSGPLAPEYTATTYDGLNRQHQVYSPTRCNPPDTNCGEPTWGATTYDYDALNRPTSVVESDGTSTQRWSYNGNVVTYTDENGIQWQRTYDALNRLTKVLEPDTSNKPTIETDYQYDALDNVTRVDQWGGPGGSSGDRIRTFTYDSLSRLITAANKETGTVCYGQMQGDNCVGGYDGNGNLLYKTDARGSVTAYTYDALNRLTSKSYPNDTSTPTSCYQYDSSSVTGAGGNLIGRLANEWTQSASAGTCPAALPGSGVLTRRSILAYDAMGRISSEQQCTPTNCSIGTPYSVTHDYDLAGNPTMYTNGIGSITLTNAYDAADHLLSVTSSWDDATHPSPLFSAPIYYAGGQLNTATYGTGLSLSRTYNNRLWQTGETDTGGIVVSPIAGSAALTITGAEQTK